MKQHVWAIIVMILASLPCAGANTALTEGAASTQPVKTGDFDITFAQRSPLSGQKELTRRLNLKEATGEDYDLSKRPYRIYVPRNYDPTVPCGIFIYLGYKDAVVTPPLWHTAMDKAHLIFITPVCHTGSHYPNSVPLWQTTGLALDAVYNLKQQYAINDRRLYLMSFTDGAMQVPLATADTFTGFIVCLQASFYRRIVLPDRSYVEATFPSAPAALMSQAHKRAFILADDGSEELGSEMKREVSAMKQDGFDRVTQISLSLTDDLHYPMFKTQWFEQKAIPFLDGGMQEAAHEKEIQPVAASGPATTPARTEPTSAPSPAQHLMTMAQLYINGGQTDLAKEKLQEVLDNYPNDPLAPKAKAMLDQLNGQ
jgi:hypothetical protein